MALRSLIVKIGADATEVRTALSKIGADASKVQETLANVGKLPGGADVIAQLGLVQKNITRVTDAQQRLATDSENAARGILAIGGPARLTSTQLDEMARTVNKGIDAFRALGREAPAELQKVARAIQQQQQQLAQLQAGPAGSGSVLGGGLSGLLPTLGATAGAALGSTLVFAAKQALDYADALEKLKDRTGIEEVALQKLDAIARPSGNTLEQLANAINRFQKNLEGGDEKALGAIGRLGLDVAHLKSLAPDEQFLAIARAIQTIQNPANQTLAAIEIFGRQGAEILPSLKAKVDELANSTSLMSAESVKALDDFGDSIGQLKRSAIADIGELLAFFIKTAKAIKDGANEIKGLTRPPTEAEQREQPRLATAKGGPPVERPPLPILPNIGQQFGGQITRNGLVGDIFQNLPTGTITGLPGAQGQNAQQIAAVTAQLHAQQAAAEALGLSLEDYVKKLDAANRHEGELLTGTSQLTQQQRAQILQFQSLGLSVEEISVKLAVSQTAVKAFEDAMQSEVDAVNAAHDATGRIQQQIGHMAVGFNGAGQAVVGFSGLLHAQLGGMQVFSKGVESIFVQLQRLGQFNASVLVQRGGILSESSQFFNQPSSSAGGLLGATNFTGFDQPFQSLQSVQLAGFLALPNVTSSLHGATVETTKWHDELGAVSTSLSHLAQISNGTFGSVVREIGTVISALDTVEKGINAFQNAKTPTGQAAGAATVLAGGIAGLVAATSTQSATANVLGGAASGALTGASIGSVVPGLGTGVGAGVGAGAGAVIGFIRSQQTPEAEQLAEDLGRSLGLHISAGLAEQFQEDADKFGARVAGLLNLGTILQQRPDLAMGGNLQNTIQQATNLFALSQTAAADLERISTIFEQVFTQILPNAVDSFTGLATADFQQLVQFAEAFHVESASLTSFINNQVNNNILGGINAFLGAGGSNIDSLQKKLEILQKQAEIAQNAAAHATTDAQRRADINHYNALLVQINDVNRALGLQGGLMGQLGIKSQETASALGGSLFVAFQELVVNGTSWLDALKQILPTFESLDKALKNAGFSGGAAFEALRPMFDLIKDPSVAAAIKEIGGLGQVLSGLANLDRLSPALLTGLGNNIGDLIDSILSSSGKNRNNVLSLFQPDLQRLFELQQRNPSVVFDDKTEALLREALAKGFIGDQFKSAAERQIDQIKRTNQILEAIGLKLGATIPNPKPVPGTGPPGSPTNPLPVPPPEVPIPGPASTGRVLPFLPKGTSTPVSATAITTQVVQEAIHDTLLEKLRPIYVDQRNSFFLDAQQARKLADGLRAEIQVGGSTQTAWRRVSK